MNNSPDETSALQMSCDSRQYASIFCIFTFEWQELGLRLTFQLHTAVPRNQDHFSGVFPGLLGYFFKVGPDTVSMCLRRCLCPHQLPNVTCPLGVVQPRMTCLHVQGPWTSMFCLSCTSYSARGTGFCLCPAKLVWQPISPAC